MWQLIIILLLGTITFLVILRLSSGFESPVTVVMAVCGHASDVERIQTLCIQEGCDLVVFDKCNNCKDVSNCVTLPNVGREQGTWLQYIIDNYSKLPEKILFLPAPIDKYNRIDKGLKMLKEPHTGDPIGEHAEFTLDEWRNESLTPADPRPFRAWYEKHIGKWDPSTPAVYWNGVMATTRNRILSKPKEFYEKLQNIVSVSNNSEAGHYMERSMGAVF